MLRQPAAGVAAFAGLGLAGGLAMGVAHPPHGWWPAAPVAAALFSVIAARARSDAEALAGGLAYGLVGYGLILGWLFAGVKGDHAPLLAYGGPLTVISLFAAAPALVAFFARRLAAPAWARMVLTVPALWLLAEWGRHFTAFRFPWAHLGYSQVPDGPLAPLAPVVGVLGLGFVTVAAGGLIGLIATAGGWRPRVKAAAGLAALLVVARLSAEVEWTRPVGAPLSVALLQGAFPMGEKFQVQAVADALRSYGALALESRAKIAVMPETAIPLLESVVPAGYFPALERRAQEEGRDVLVTFFRDIPGHPDAYHSSARVLGASGRSDYDKRILAPFAEYVPAPGLLRPLYERVATVPMLDTRPGSETQMPLVLGGMRVALRLCFEDLFGHAHREEAAQARFLVVLANDSWNGTDVPMHQHLAAAQARALEAAKPLVRVGNTGWTGLIAPDGRLAAGAPPHRRTVLEVAVQPRAGVTPYLRYGDAIPVGMALLALAASAAVRASYAPAPAPRRTTA